MCLHAKTEPQLLTSDMVVYKAVRLKRGIENVVYLSEFEPGKREKDTESLTEGKGEVLEYYPFITMTDPIGMYVRPMIPKYMNGDSILKCIIPEGTWVEFGRDCDRNTSIRTKHLVVLYRVDAGGHRID